VRSLVLLLLMGCATAKVIGPPVVTTPDPNVARVVVLEPFFETAEWKTEVVRIMSNSPSLMPMGGVSSRPFASSSSPLSPSPLSSGTTEIVQTSKPLLAQVDALAAEHRLVLQAVQKLRPSWRVSSTSGLAALEGEVTLVRVIIESNQIVGSDRPLHTAAFAFGLVLLPLQIYNFWPVEETERVYGALERYVTDAPTVKTRLVRYKTQPDSAFNASGFTPLKRDFGLDITYEEGLLADERPRKAALIEGFSERLASAIVAIVEETP
jgi:hypothetical protein